MRGAVLRLVLLVCLTGCAVAVGAEEMVDVCFNYGCNGSAWVTLDEERLAAVGALLGGAVDAESERGAIALAVGMMYRLAGMQTPVSADRAGNFRDDGVDGRMDCIDHSITTTRFLEVMAGRGWLRFHRVLAPQRRAPLFIFQHFSAAIEQTPAGPASDAGTVPDYVATVLENCDCGEAWAETPSAGVEPAPSVQHNTGARFVVDSWFVEHGEPAVVLPLEDWMNGDGPNVG